MGDPNHADLWWLQVMASLRRAASDLRAPDDDLALAAIWCELAMAMVILLPDPPDQPNARRARLPDTEEPTALLAKAKELALQLSREAGILVPAEAAAGGLLDPHTHEHLPTSFGPMLGYTTGLVYAASIHRGRVRAELEAALVSYLALADDLNEPVRSTTDEPDLDREYVIRAWPMHLEPAMQLTELMDELPSLGALMMYSGPLGEAIRELTDWAPEGQA